MSLLLPLSVRLLTPRVTRRITAEVRDLRFRSVAPGGFANATVSLHRPLDLQPDEIAYYGRLQIHDGRTGRVAWEGRLEDPGRSAGTDGMVWDLAAIGPSGHVHDVRTPLIYVDRSLSGSWERSVTWSRRGSVTQITDLDDGDTPCLLLQAPEGNSVPTNYRVDMLYRHIKIGGQTIGRIFATVNNPIGTPNWENQLVTRLSGGTVVDSATWATLTPSNLVATVAGTIPVGDNVAHVRILRTGAGATASEDSWAEFYDVSICAVRQDASGNDILSGYTTSTVRADQVVNDLLGRLLPQFDGPNAVVTTTSYAIDQLAFPNGVTAGEVLADLMERFEPGYYWAAWEANPDGLYRFEWVPWPTLVRYEVDLQAGMRSTGSAASLYNQVRVRWRNARGSILVTTRTQTVPELDDAGLVRSGWIDLGNDLGATTVQAQRAGDDFLAEHLTPANAGSLTVAKPIVDLISGMQVWPWEILPGNLIRVRGIQPRVDSLNATTRDGVSVFRIVSVEFSASDAMATLELDSYAPSLARAISDLQAGQP